MTTGKLTVFALLLGAMSLSCSQERSLSPQPTDWVVYAAGWNFRQIYILDADSLSVVDSIPFRGSPLLMGTNPSGEYLYVWSDNRGIVPPGTYIFDTKEKNLVHYSAVSLGRTRFASHGRLLIRNSTYYEGEPLTRTYFCDPLTLTALDSLPDNLQFRDALNQGDTILVQERGSGNLRLLDLETGRMTGLYTASTRQAYMWYARVAPDGRSAAIVSDGAIEIGDLLTGEILMSVRSRGPGQVDISPDGSHAIVSTPILDAWFEASPSRLYLFDLRNRVLAAYLEGFSESNDLECGGLCSFLPDGTRALVGAIDGWNYGPLQVFDAKSGSIIRWIDLPTEDSDVRCFGVGRAPK